MDGREKPEQTIRERLPRKPRKTLKGHGGGVNAVAFSPDGKTLASGRGSDGAVKLWAVPYWRPEKTGLKPPDPRSPREVGRFQVASADRPQAGQNYEVTAVYDTTTGKVSVLVYDNAPRRAGSSSAMPSEAAAIPRADQIIARLKRAGYTLGAWSCGAVWVVEVSGAGVTMQVTDQTHRRRSKRCGHLHNHPPRNPARRRPVTTAGHLFIRSQSRPVR